MKKASKNSAASKAGGPTPVEIELNMDFSLKILFGGDFGLPDLDLLETISTGIFGRTRLVRSLRDRRYYSLKIMKKSRIVQSQQLKHVQNEVVIMSRLRCVFAIEMKAFFQDESSLYLMTEFVPGGELYSHLRRSKFFPLNVYQFYAVEVACAIEYMHRLQIVHRDLKPENILITQEGHIRIADFSLAKILGPQQQQLRSGNGVSAADAQEEAAVAAALAAAAPDVARTARSLHQELLTFTLCGTPEYLAPEVIEHKGYGASVDWWALGVLLYEMAVGHPPFYGRNPFTVYRKILECRVPLDDSIPKQTAAAVTALLITDRVHRLGCGSGGFQQLKQHGFFRGVDWNSAQQQLIVPPMVPAVSMDGDTSNFDYYPEEGVGNSSSSSSAGAESSAPLTLQERTMFQAFDEILERPKQV